MKNVSASPRLSPNALAHLLMFAVVMLWGATFVLVKEAVAKIGPQWFNALRMMLAFACLAIVYHKYWRHLNRRLWQFGAAAGGSLACGYIFQTQGLVYTTATNSAFITALVVVLVPIFTTLPWLRPPNSKVPNTAVWIGAVLALIGVAMLTLPSHAGWSRLLNTQGSESWGNFLSLICAFGFSMYVIVLAHAAGRVQYQPLILLQIGFAMVFLAAAALILEPQQTRLLLHPFSRQSPLSQPLVQFALLVTGILATALAFGVQTWAQQVIPSSNIAVILTLEPVFAWLTAFVVLKEKMDLHHCLGAVLILLGIFAAEIMPRRRERGKENSKEAST